MAEIVVAEVTAYDSGLPGTRTLYFATQSFVTHPGDTPANTFYDGRIKQPALVERSCFQSGKTFGASQIGYGELLLVNNDGGLDDYAAYSYAGRAISVKLGTVYPNSGGIPTYTDIITGTMNQAEFSWTQLSIKIRDRQQDLAVPLQGNLYGGTNSLPNGVDGVADDLKGKRLPLVYGKVKGVSPPCVNTSRLIYQLNDGAINSIEYVYDRGVALTVGTAHASLVALEGATPAAGSFDYYLGGGYIRLGSSPTGTITVDCTEGAATSNRTAAQIMNKILLKAGISSGDINATDVTDLDTDANYECGIYIPHDDAVTGIAAMDEVANSVGAYWGIDRLGEFRMRKIADPSAGTSIGEITGIEVLSIDRTATRDYGGGVPSWSITLGYAKNYTPTNDLAAAVTLAERNRMREAYRTIVDEDSAVLTAHLYSPSLRFDTLIVSEADAATEAATRRDLYGVTRDMYQVRVKVDEALADIIDIGEIITLDLPRYDLSGGKKFLIISVRTDMRNNIFDLTLWG